MGRRGFTIIEILLVIIILGILGGLSLNAFLDFRKDAMVALKVDFIHSLQDAVKDKRVQMTLYCGKNTYPRVQALIANDITENGAPGADCTAAQITKSEERKFLSTGEQPLVVPLNQSNNYSNLAACNCTSICDPTCYLTAGFCYNQALGVVWAEGTDPCNTP